MIQRIQSIYLFAAAALMTLTLFLPMATLTAPDGSETILRGLPSDGITNPQTPVLLAQPVSLTIALSLSALLPLIAIFLYRKRSLQIKFCIAELVLLVLSLALAAFHVDVLCRLLETHLWRLGIAAVLILISLILIIFALRAVIRDERLVKSLDRFR